MEKGPQLIIACALPASAAWCLRQSSRGLLLQPCVVSRFCVAEPIDDNKSTINNKGATVKVVNS